MFVIHDWWGPLYANHETDDAAFQAAAHFKPSNNNNIASDDEIINNDDSDEDGVVSYQQSKDPRVSKIKERNPYL